MTINHSVEFGSRKGRAAAPSSNIRHTLREVAVGVEILNVFADVSCPVDRGHRSEIRRLSARLSQYVNVVGALVDVERGDATITRLAGPGKRALS